MIASSSIRRSVLRAVATATNQIEFFDTSGCYGGEDPSIHDNEVFKSSRSARDLWAVLGPWSP